MATQSAMRRVHPDTRKRVAAAFLQMWREALPAKRHGAASCRGELGELCKAYRVSPKMVKQWAKEFFPGEYRTVCDVGGNDDC